MGKMVERKQKRVPVLNTKIFLTTPAPIATRIGERHEAHEINTNQLFYWEYLVIFTLTLLIPALKVRPWRIDY